MNLTPLTRQHCEEGDRALLNGKTLDEIFEEKLIPLRNPGAMPKDVRKHFDCASSVETAIDLLSNGLITPMQEGFKPNEGRECGHGTSYLSRMPLCNHSLVEFIKLGRGIVLSWDVLVKTNQLKNCYISAIVHALSKKVEGRTCLHNSKSSRSFPSVNESIDLDEAHRLYPQHKLFGVAELSELACQQQQKYPEEVLSGCQVDVVKAYNNIPQTVESAKLHAALVKAQCPDGSWIDAVFFFLCNQFGTSIGGDAYGAISACIDEQHNAVTGRSRTYIDDGCLIDSPRLIQQSREEYHGLITSLMSIRAINPAKDHVWQGKLEAIGWIFDFVKWTVLPKPRAMAKLLVAVFKTIRPGQRSATVEQLDVVTGLLSWYSAVIPMGRSFLTQLFKCKGGGHDKHKVINLSKLAKTDLDWWRALILVGQYDRTLVAASIDSLRTNKLITRHMRTDASSTIGGGGVLSLEKGGTPLDMPGGAIRWTRREFTAFQEMGVCINTLEFFAVMFFVMLWAPQLRNQTVSIQCDNTSAVSWLMKRRAKGGGETADVLVKIFVLFCLIENITIVGEHIAGILNIEADFRSRDLMYAPQELDEETMFMDSSKGCERAMRCRQLLLKAVMQPGTLRGPTLLAELMTLRISRG